MTIPEPAALKMLKGRGNGKDVAGRKIKQPAAYVRLPPEPPIELGPQAQQEWDRVVPELQRLNLTKPIDAVALASYCSCWQRFYDAQMIIAEEGILAFNSQGRVRHPAVAVVEAASKELRGWCQEFGLTPSAEQRVARSYVGDDEAASPFGDQAQAQAS